VGPRLPTLTVGLRRGRRRGLPSRRTLALVPALSALAIAGCGNTLQDQPIPHNSLETLMLAPFPVYWLGASFHGLAITEAGEDPSGAFSVQYGDCLEGGQSTCVPKLKVITSPDNSFVPGETDPSHVRARVRGVSAVVAERGAAIAIPTGPVVLDVYAHTPTLARAAAETAVPMNFPGSPRAPLAAPLPNTGFGERPLPTQTPPPLPLH
jgi:hypothetical protein